MKRHAAAVVLSVLAASAGCVYPHTRALTEPPPPQESLDASLFDGQAPQRPQYYFHQLGLGPGNSNGLLVLVAFSGGGTRAAALSYGVLDMLRRIEIGCPDTGTCRGTLLDEVDVISSTSGGSFTSSYYALYGDDIFDPAKSFHRRFLKYNVQRELLGSAVYRPQSWPKLLHRVEIAADLYARLLYPGKTFADLARRPRPFVILNAADYVSQKRVQFTQDEFDLLCVDLNAFPVARAVAASSAFPGLLNSMTVQTHNPCSVPTEPGWLANVKASPMDDRLAYREFLDYNALTDPDRRFLHLLDGGLADNLGLRSIYEGLRQAPGALPLRNMLVDPVMKVSNVLIVVVNARTGDKSTAASRRALGPLTPQVVLGATSGIPMGTVTYDSVDMLTELLDSERQTQLVHELQTRLDPNTPPLASTAKIFAVELTFDNITDEPTRRYFKSLPTDFMLPPATVDCLISEGRQLLSQSASYGGASESFSDYVKQALQGRVPPPPDKPEVTGNRCAVVPAS
jgi:predicted acylesterase/phospholipase RssA